MRRKMKSRNVVVEHLNPKDVADVYMQLLTASPCRAKEASHSNLHLI